MRDSLLPSQTFKIYAANLLMNAITIGLAALCRDHMGFSLVLAFLIFQFTSVAALIIAPVWSVFSVIGKMIQASKNKTVTKLKNSDITNLIVSLATLAISPFAAMNLLSPIALVIVIPSVAICLLEGGLRVRERFAKNNQAIINKAPKQPAKQASEIVYSKSMVLQWNHTSPSKQAKDKAQVPSKKGPFTRSQTRRLMSK